MTRTFAAGFIATVLAGFTTTYDQQENVWQLSITGKELAKLHLEQSLIVDGSFLKVGAWSGPVGLIITCAGLKITFAAASALAVAEHKTDAAISVRNRVCIIVSSLQ